MPYFGEFLIVGARPYWTIAYMLTGLLGNIFYDSETKTYSWKKGTDVYEVSPAEEQLLVEKMIDAIKRWEARIQ